MTLPGGIVGKLDTIPGVLMVMPDPGTPEPIALEEPGVFQ